jgi:lysine 2,3-aminomutase
MKHDETTPKHTKKITSLASGTTDSNTLSISNGYSWQKELNNNITSAQEIAQKLHLTKEEERRINRITSQFPMSITRYYASLINPEDPKDPIRKMCVPSASELYIEGHFDTSGEQLNTKLDGIQHKYHNTVLVMSTNTCASYCRFCFRKRLVGLSTTEILNRIDTVTDYIQNHPEVDNVLISGGDSFMNDNSVIERYLQKLFSIDHIQYVRFGSRIPVVYPMRIYQDKEFLRIMKTYAKQKQIYVITHFNHPNECTPQAKKAIKALHSCGVTFRNQTVLLRGVNNDPTTLAILFNTLNAWGVVPYYIFQCRPVKGVKRHFQVPLLQGCNIVKKTRKKLSGLAKSFRFVMSHYTGKIEILGRLSEHRLLCKYHQVRHDKDHDKMMVFHLQEDQSWIDLKTIDNTEFFS